MTLSRLALMVCAGASIAHASVALATEPGVNQARLVMANYARCVVDKNAALARIAVLGQPGSHLRGAAFRRLFDPTCLTGAGGIAMRSVMIKGAMAEELIHKKFQISDDAAQLESQPPLSWVTALDTPAGSDENRAESDLGENARPMAIRESLMGRIAECVVRRLPTESASLFRTKPSSGREDNAIELLKPAYASCLRGEQNDPGDRTEVRASLAVAYYRLASPAAATGSTH